MQKTAQAQGSFAHAKTLDTQKRIGSTVYEVTVFLSRNEEQTIEKKLLRLVKNGLNPATKNDRMNIPQTGRLLERNSS